MAKPIQESLASGSDAIPRATVESEVCGGKIRVRYKTRAGYVYRRDFKDRDEAHAFFLECVEKLRDEEFRWRISRG